MRANCEKCDFAFEPAIDARCCRECGRVCADGFYEVNFTHPSCPSPSPSPSPFLSSSSPSSSSLGFCDKDERNDGGDADRQQRRRSVTLKRTKKRARELLASLELKENEINDVVDIASKLTNEAQRWGRKGKRKRCSLDVVVAAATYAMARRKRKPFFSARGVADACGVSLYEMGRAYLICLEQCRGELETEETQRIDAEAYAALAAARCPEIRHFILETEKTKKRNASCAFKIEKSAFMDDVKVMMKFANVRGVAEGMEPISIVAACLLVTTRARDDATRKILTVEKVASACYCCPSTVAKREREVERAFYEFAAECNALLLSSSDDNAKKRKKFFITSSTLCECLNIFRQALHRYEEKSANHRSSKAPAVYHRNSSSAQRVENALEKLKKHVDRNEKDASLFDITTPNQEETLGKDKIMEQKKLVLAATNIAKVSGVPRVPPPKRERINGPNRGGKRMKRRHASDAIGHLVSERLKTKALQDVLTPPKSAKLTLNGNREIFDSDSSEGSIREGQEESKQIEWHDVLVHKALVQGVPERIVKTEAAKHFELERNNKTRKQNKKNIRNQSSFGFDGIVSKWKEVARAEFNRDVLSQNAQNLTVKEIEKKDLEAIEALSDDEDVVNMVRCGPGTSKEILAVKLLTAERDRREVYYN